MKKSYNNEKIHLFQITTYCNIHLKIFMIARTSTTLFITFYLAKEGSFISINY